MFYAKGTSKSEDFDRIYEVTYSFETKFSQKIRGGKLDLDNLKSRFWNKKLNFRFLPAAASSSPYVVLTIRLSTFASLSLQHIVLLVQTEKYFVTFFFSLQSPQVLIIFYN